MDVIDFAMSKNLLTIYRWIQLHVSPSYSVTLKNTKGMIEKIDINDASIAEAVRKQMSEATFLKNGLMSISDKKEIPQKLYLATGGDLNNVTFPSIVAFAAGCSNAPFDMGIVHVSTCALISNELIVQQSAYGRENNYGKISYRTYRESKGWGNWITVL